MLQAQTGAASGMAPFDERGDMALISIDFHNTLFECDRWFQLEIETLPLAFLQWREENGADPVTDEVNSDALLAYRKIRRRVTASGEECDAVSSLVQVCDALNLTTLSGEIEHAVCEIMRSVVADSRPLDGAPNLVRQLHERGHTLAVVSSAAYHPFLEWTLEHHNMRHAFSVIVTSASCGIYKSNPAIYRHVVDMIGVTVRDAVHIGDSPRFDVASAREAGMKTVLLTDRPDAVPEPAPDATISSLGEAETVLDTLLSSQ